MNPVSGLTIYRTKGDTDPLTFNLRVMSNGVTTPIANTANVIFSATTGIATILQVQGTGVSNGVFTFPMANVNFANTDLSEFEIHVQDSYSYVIASGVIRFRDRLS